MKRLICTVAILLILCAPAPEPTAEERIAALEDELAATKILLGLEE